MMSRQHEPDDDFPYGVLVVVALTVIAGTLALSLLGSIPQ